MSPSMWNESATRDIEFVTYPVMISTKKKLIVSVITESSRHFFPLNLPIFQLQRHNKINFDSPPALIFIQSSRRPPESEKATNFSQCLTKTFSSSPFRTLVLLNVNRIEAKCESNCARNFARNVVEGTLGLAAHFRCLKLRQSAPLRPTFA